MSQNIPQLHRLLSNNLEDFMILEQKVRALTAPGEHYGSVMLAVDLKLQSTKNSEEKTLNLVAKLIPANEMLRKVFDVGVTFKKEVLAYTIAIPVLVELQKEHSVPLDKSFENLFPLCYGARVSAKQDVTEVDDTAVLIFENLKSHGFYTEDRLRGYNAEAARVILKDLARFHATPIALKLLKPQVFEEKIKLCLVKNRGLEQVPEIFEVFHRSIMDGAKDCPELEPYWDKIEKMCDDIISRGSDDKYLPTEHWATISHNDFWTSNSMILKNEEGKYVKSKILDLQLTTYNSAVSDLVFFMFTSIVNEDLDRYFFQFVQIYYDNFIDTLKDFGVNLAPFTWVNFQHEFEEIGKSEMYHILSMLKPICTERGVVKNTAENFVDSDWTRKDLLGPNHRRKLKDTIFAFIKRKWL